jgi:hypothetical protein
MTPSHEKEPSKLKRHTSIHDDRPDACSASSWCGEDEAFEVFHDADRSMNERVEAYRVMEAANGESVGRPRAAIARMIRRMDAAASSARRAWARTGDGRKLTTNAALAEFGREMQRLEPMWQVVEVARRAIHHPVPVRPVVPRARSRERRTTRRATARAGPNLDDSEPAPPSRPGRLFDDALTLAAGGAS